MACGLHYKPHFSALIGVCNIKAVYPGLCDCFPLIYFPVFAPVVVSKMPNESVAHRPVEMLPLVCQRDQREAAQLQVRQHAPQQGLSAVQFVFYIAVHTHFLTSREKMAQAYDFALDKIGMEIMSYQVEISEHFLSRVYAYSVTCCQLTATCSSCRSG